VLVPWFCVQLKLALAAESSHPYLLIPSCAFSASCQPKCLCSCAV